MTDLFYRDGTPLAEQDRPKVKPTKRADTFSIIRYEPCSRCGGAGGAEMWRYTGYTCYQCGGRNSTTFHAREVKLYAASRLAQLNEVAARKAARKQAEADHRAAKKRAEFIAWAKPHGKLIGRILRAERPYMEDFLSDLARKIQRKLALSDRQLEAAAKVLDARDERERQDHASEHVGNVGDRIEFEATVEFTTVRDSLYGVTTIIKLRDDNGNVFVWFASDYRNVERGDRVNIRGTVKKHDEYRGVNQTVLTRCKYDKFRIMDADAVSQTEELA